MAKRRRISDPQVAEMCEVVGRWHGRVFTAAVERRALPMRSIDNHEPSWWLRSTVDELGQRVVAGQVDFCPHLGVGSSVYMALWRPDIAVCRTCWPRLWSGMRGTPDDAQCDRCGGHDRHGKINGGLLVLGAVILTFGLCDDCAAREGTLA